jgi:hypothetical protein
MFVAPGGHVRGINYKYKDQNKKGGKGIPPCSTWYSENLNYTADKYLCIIFTLLHTVLSIAGFIMHVQSNTNIVMITVYLHITKKLAPG